MHLHFHSASDSSAELPGNLRIKSSWIRFVNYIKTLFFFFIVFVAWFLLGLTATHAFPINLVKSLTGYLFSGFQTYKWQLNKALDQSLKSVWGEVQLKAGDIATPESVIETRDKEEARKLNRLDSEYWLLVNVIDLLSVGVDPSDRDLIDWKLNELDEKRDVLQSRLVFLKRKHYKILSQVQAAYSTFYSLLTFRALKRNREFSRVEQILTHLEIAYAEQISSKENIQEMLEVLDEKLVKNPRVKVLHKISRLLNWAYSYIEDLTPIDSEDPKYKDYPVRVKRGRPCYHLPNGCSHYPRVEKPEDSNSIQFFRTIEEAELQNLDLCGSCNRILRTKGRLH